MSIKYKLKFSVLAEHDLDNTYNYNYIYTILKALAASNKLMQKLEEPICHLMDNPFRCGSC